jgi:hypothetical protein
VLGEAAMDVHGGVLCLVWPSPVGCACRVPGCRDQCPPSLSIPAPSTMPARTRSTIQQRTTPARHLP